MPRRARPNTVAPPSYDRRRRAPADRAPADRASRRGRPRALSASGAISGTVTGLLDGDDLGRAIHVGKELAEHVPADGDTPACRRVFLAEARGNAGSTGGTT